MPELTGSSSRACSAVPGRRFSPVRKAAPARLPVSFAVTTNGKPSARTGAGERSPIDSEPYRGRPSSGRAWRAGGSIGWPERMPGPRRRRTWAIREPPFRALGGLCCFARNDARSRPPSCSAACTQIRTSEFVVEARIASPFDLLRPARKLQCGKHAPSVTILLPCPSLHHVRNRNAFAACRLPPGLPRASSLRHCLAAFRERSGVAS